MIIYGEVACKRQRGQTSRVGTLWRRQSMGEVMEDKALSESCVMRTQHLQWQESSRFLFLGQGGKGDPSQRKMYCLAFRPKGGRQRDFSCICCSSAAFSSKQSFYRSGTSWSGRLTSPAFLLQMRKLSPRGSTRGFPRQCRLGASLGLSPTLACLHSL